MVKIFIDSILNLIGWTILIFTGCFISTHIQLSIHYHRANIPPLLILFIVTFESLLSSFISGWLMLAKYYSNNISSPSELSTCQTGSIGLLVYRNSLNIGITASGIYLSCIFLMSLFHPPLLIPWENINKATINSFDEYEISIDIPIFPNSPTIIKLPKKSLEKAKDILKDKSKNKH
ncbi:MAG: hypothetical protein AAFQ91_00470 [Cyanobacteria bacterium J06621_15]